MKADKAKITRLLKTARGQLDGLLKMVEDDRYCIDISNQLMATQAILRKTNLEIMHAHLDSCVREALEKGDSTDSNEKLNEIMNILDKILK
ncbi:metal-sensing transcriptional repressor [Caproiciproducens galactitolivorans]|uniref:Copper-sensing transcriptional repressor CsoR n=1 Tax=Caproiciproducens galactitolivorans TaxID=642589 RepID=A0A4Z0YAB6_9FIRM|nr:metal-sensing transcriptional repressor [Caproiciproducens galactitolivorans]QEY35823.1 metal-sensing transcriptional repressor [Caproiciproducens galactitolivorans]TGJ75753.1 copper-sensing transcriptional repressor CsoR [Caproiciproducens galactitolivorans]